MLKDENIKKLIFNKFNIKNEIYIYIYIYIYILF
jgi:hypothetical protein